MLFHEHGGGLIPEDGIHERRARERFKVRWPVRLCWPGSASIETTLVNISPEGFYCVIPASPRKGERLRCDITVVSQPSANSHPTRLLCDVEVVRVEATLEGYGVGCSIKDYTVVLV